LDTRTANDHFPGIGRYVINLARAMAPPLAPDEDLILLHDPSQPSHWDLGSLTGEQVEVVETSLTPFSPRQQWIVPRLLRGLSADLYHSPYYLMPYRPDVPTLVTIHDLIPMRFPEYYSPTQRLIFAVTVRLAIRAAQRVIAVSRATARGLQDLLGLSETRTAVVPEAADPAFYPRPAAQVEAVRSKYGLSGPYLLYLGSNKPHKNLTRLVKAWAQVYDAQHATRSSHLVIAGVWDARYPEPSQRAEQLNLTESVRWLGPVPETDLPALYTGATVFVFPSLYEGFGLPVLEAMACGIPVACANTSALPEVAGDAALLFDPNVVDSVAQALSQLLEDPELRAHLIRQGLRRAAQFSWDRTARETLNQYRGLLDAAAHRAKAGADEPVDTGH
jgi:alpha-1,3-rhamnosyl/mannosyltransferase